MDLSCSIATCLVAHVHSPLVSLALSLVITLQTETDACVYSSDGILYRFQLLLQPALWVPTNWNVLMRNDGLTLSLSPCAWLSKYLGQLCNDGADEGLRDTQPRQVIRYADRRNRERFRWEFFHGPELYPLRNYSFAGAFSVSGPADPYPYLNRVYGSWLWGRMPALIPTGLSGVQFGQTWTQRYFMYQHHFD